MTVLTFNSIFAPIDRTFLIFTVIIICIQCIIFKIGPDQERFKVWIYGSDRNLIDRTVYLIIKKNGKK